MGKDNKSKRYIIVPVTIIKNLIMDKNTFISILYLGLHKYSEGIEVVAEEAIKDAVCCYHNERENLPESLISIIADCTDEYYRGFNTSGEYEAESEIEYILPILEENPELNRTLEEWYRIRRTCSYFGVRTRIQSVLNCVRQNSELYNSANAPLFKVNADMIIDRAIEPERTTPDQRAKLAMYLGILSIVGKEDYFKASSELIKCRMFGCKDSEELEARLQEDRFKEAYDKYTTRRKYDRYLRELQEDGAIAKLGIKNSTYLSVRLSFNELEERVRKEFAKNKPKENKLPEGELIRKYLE